MSKPAREIRDIIVDLIETRISAWQPWVERINDLTFTLGDLKQVNEGLTDGERKWQDQHQQRLDVLKRCNDAVDELIARGDWLSGPSDDE